MRAHAGQENITFPFLPFIFFENCLLSLNMYLNTCGIFFVLICYEISAYDPRSYSFVMLRMCEVYGCSPTSETQIHRVQDVKSNSLAVDSNASLQLLIHWSLRAVHVLPYVF